ncbi:hypothetical protein ACFWZW_13300 [Microbacterium enclense]|uniref:hypothetical protein n=1 Tax=Microbacterium enclense TaxID=993073 RepID=UPI0036DB4777
MAISARRDDKRPAFWTTAVLGAFVLVLSWLWLGAVIDGAAQDQGRTDTVNSASTLTIIGYAPLVIAHLCVIPTVMILGAKSHRDSFVGVMIAVAVILAAVAGGALVSFALWSPGPAAAGAGIAPSAVVTTC